MTTDTSADIRSVLIERVMSHPPQKIWRALTQSPLIEEWLMPNDFEPVVGRKFNFRSTPMPQWNGVVDCEVVIVEPDKRLAYRWDALGVTTIVTFTLTPTASGTLVRMEQSGFRPEQTANYQGATYGWQKFIAGLERVAAGLA
jgi:uncharacterized protein YndB with AHSA1/START domain